MVPPHGTDLDVIVESEMVEIVEGGDAQSEGTTHGSIANPPEGEEEQPMETTPPASPVSPTEDDLLSGATAATAGWKRNWPLSGLPLHQKAKEATMRLPVRRPLE